MSFLKHYTSDGPVEAQLLKKKITLTASSQIRNTFKGITVTIESVRNNERQQNTVIEIYERLERYKMVKTQVKFWAQPRDKIVFKNSINEAINDMPTVCR